MAVCVSETWLSQDKLDLINFPDFKIASSFCRKERIGGGVCIILKKEIESIDRPDITNMSMEYILEICAAELPKENILLINIYWNRREEELFFSQLEKILNYVNKKYHKNNVILGGDLNINVINNNPKTRRLLDLMSENGFTLRIKKATRNTNTTSTCIDLLFTNFAYPALDVSVEELGFSDHASIVIRTQFQQSQKIKPWNTIKRKYNTKNIDNFKTNLAKINWQQLLSANNNIDENYNIFHEIIQNLLNTYIPKVKTKLKTINRNKWLSKGIKISCQNKRLLKVIVQKSKNLTLLNYYKKYEKILKKTVKIAKKRNNKIRIQNASNTVKTMWDIVNENTNKKKNPEKRNIHIRKENVLITDPSRVANTLNNYFATVGETTDNNQTDTLSQHYAVLHPTTNTMFLSQVNTNEIHKSIKTLKNKNSSGIDELPPSLLKRCADELASPFTTLINQSFNEGKFPTILKRTIIHPIHKKQDKTDPNNYRPIALLPTASKLFEKAMCNRILNFCEKYNILDDNQNGFRKKRSTVLAVFKFMQEAINLINNKKYAIGILIDMSKAYDRVQHNILIKKLHGIGIRGQSLEWIKSYLQDREQQVEIKHYNKKASQIQTIRSDRITTNASIPQGSVIGCLLFLIYINDLPKILNDHCTLFADDVSILTSCEDSTTINEKLLKIIEIVKNWLTIHNLKINITKTKLLTFHPYQKEPLKINLTYNGETLKQVTDSTLLGLTIDTNINWQSHVTNINSKISKFAYALREVKKSTDEKTALVTYYAYAYSWLKYGVMLWGNSTNVPSLFTQQKKLIRIIANIQQTDSCKLHFQRLKLLTLPCIYIYETCHFVIKHPEFFKTRQEIPTKYSFRPKTQNRLMLPTSRLNLHSKSPLVMCVKIFNKLPSALKSIPNEKEFLKKLKDILIKKCYYKLEEYFKESI